MPDLAATLLVNDHPCIRCGYSLRGLEPTANCPECGTPIERSLMGDTLVFSDEAYVQTLRRGAGFIMASILLMVVVAVAGVALGLARLTTLIQLLPFVALAASLSLIAGWWLLTAPDMGQLSVNKGEKPRRTVRFCLTISVVLKALSVILPSVPAMPTILISVVSAVDSIAAAVAFFAGMLYIRWLAPRIPDPRASQRAKTLMVVLSILIGLFSLGLVATLVFGGSTNSQGGGVGVVGFPISRASSAPPASGVRSASSRSSRSSCTTTCFRGSIKISRVSRPSRPTSPLPRPRCRST